MNDSVASDALVIPSSTGVEVAILAVAAVLSIELSDLVRWQPGTRSYPPISPVNSLGVTLIVYLHLAHHLTHDNLNVLIVDINTLGTVYLLYFADEVFLYSQTAQHLQDLAGLYRAFGDRGALA